MSGKGDTRRPQLIDDATMSENWERTFGDSKWAFADGEEPECATVDWLMPEVTVTDGILDAEG